jgi:hypothetical protein
MNGTRYIVNVTEAYINCIGYTVAVTETLQLYTGNFVTVTKIVLLSLCYCSYYPLPQFTELSLLTCTEPTCCNDFS